MVGKLHERKVLLAVDFNQRHVGLGVGTDDLGLVDGAVVRDDLHSSGVIHLKRVRHKNTEAGRRNEATARGRKATEKGRQTTREDILDPSRRNLTVA
jgi:hypothetical protein